MDHNKNNNNINFIAGVSVFLIIGLIFLGMYSYLHKNDINNNSAQSVFTHTGVRMKAMNDSNRSLEIIKDRNGWLYYYWDLGVYKGSILEPVVDADGNMTKDISMFEN